MPLTCALKRPLLAAWLAFAAYSMCTIVLVQFLVLPVLVPGLHAGSGLLSGTDAVGYHVIAKELAASIRAHGWAAWSLAPQGHTAAGLAAPFYYLFGDSPASLIAVNAALHATGGVILIQLMRQFGIRLAVAFAAALPWIVFPSSLQWVAQVQKDGYFFAGVLAALLGWTMLIRRIRGDADAPSLGVCAGLLVAGIACAGVARLYVLQLLLPVALVFAAFAIPQAIVSTRRGTLATLPCIAIIGLLILMLAALATAPRDMRLEPAPVAATVSAPGVPVSGEIIAGAPWQANANLPPFVDRAFIRLAIARAGYLAESYRTAGSMLDIDVQFHSAGDVLTYLPRALQVGLLAPFPADWFTRGTSPGGTTMRLVAAVEMLVLYPLLLVGLPLAAWRWRTRIEFWFGTSFCCFFIVAYACVTPNMGSLYRMRYGYLMTLAALGFAAIWMTLEKRRLRRNL